MPGHKKSQFDCGTIAIGLILSFIFLPIGLIYFLYKAGVFDKDKKVHPTPNTSQYTTPHQAKPATATQSKSSKRIFDLSKVSDPEMKKTLESAESKLIRIMSYEKKVSREDGKKKIHRLSEIVKAIIQELVKNPKDIKLARQFLNYYLDSTLTILDKYCDLSAKKIRSPEIDESVKRAEAMMDTIEEGFKKQLAKLQENDLLEMQVEMDVLEKSLRMEGF